MQPKKLSLSHLIRPNKTLVEKPGLLLMLHGYGSDENDLFSFANELPEELFIISAKAPYPLQPYGNAWYSIYFDATNGKFNNTVEAKSSVELIVRFLKESIEAYDLDAKNVTLLGFSQGAIMSYAVALNYPEKVKIVIALSGFIDRDLIAANAPSNNYAHLNIYTSHGTADQVIPVEWARMTLRFLNELNIKNSYSEFPVGHGVSPQNFFEFRNWLLEKLS